MTDEQMWGLIVAARLTGEPYPYHAATWKKVTGNDGSERHCLAWQQGLFADGEQMPSDDNHCTKAAAKYRLALVARFRPRFRPKP